MCDLTVIGFDVVIYTTIENDQLTTKVSDNLTTHNVRCCKSLSVICVNRSWTGGASVTGVEDIGSYILGDVCIYKITDTTATIHITGSSSND